jgi:hypothetical protein
MTPYEFLASLKSKWCGWDSLPPGFQFPVKELVASLNSIEAVDNNRFFYYDIYKEFKIIYE